MRARTPLPVYLTQLIGFLVLALAWWAISGTGQVESQVNWLVVAVAALGVSLAACLGWLFVGSRRIALRRMQLTASVAGKFAAVPGPSMAPEELVAAVSMTRYHRADCQLVRGKEAPPDRRSAHEQAGRTPCGVCRP